MKKQFFYFSALLMAGFMAGCDLEEALGDRTTTEDLNDASVVIEDQTNAQSNTFTVFENVNNFGFNPPTTKSANTGDPAVSWNGNTVTIDFTGVDDKSGKIIIAFSGFPVLAPNLSADITLDEFKSNGVTMDGQLEMAVLAFTASPKFSYKSVGNLMVKEGNNAAYEYNFDQTIIWALGYNTLLDTSDDTFYLEGDANMIADSKTNSMMIEDKLVFAVGCDFVKEGVVKFTNASGTEDEFEVWADFSIGASANTTGECDGWVKIYTDDLSINVNLAD